MDIRRSFLPTLLAFTTAACADSTAPLAPDPLLSHVGGGHRVVGSGHVQTPAGLREFTFHALESPAGDAPSGNAKGSYKVVLPNGLFFETDVTCLAVDGNTGWVAGTIRASNAAGVVIGSGSMFYAIDNGEGEGAPPDVVSIAAFNAAEGADLEFCEERPLLLPPLTVTDGNVQVR